MSNFRDLLVWQKSMIFVTKIYNTTKKFPKEEQFGITSQIRRSAISIPSNISEGLGRNSNKDYLRFLNIAIGSLFELQTQLEISKNIEYLT
ncbi:MAG: four helix bundle protein, partial [Flavobacterium sp.]|nr:four helix bundle protein [Flavobacterium sp.]